MTVVDPQDELDLGSLTRILFQHKLLVGAVTLVFGLAAAAYAITAIPIFRGEVVVTQATDSSMGEGATSALGSLGGLASLAGISLHGDSGPKTRETLESRVLAEQFIQRYKLLGELSSDSSKPPTIWRAVKKFKTSILTITEDTRRGTITVGINWKDPVKAARWANDYVALANEQLRTRAIEDAQRNISYLNKQIADTHVLELQRVMYNLIENETKTLMLANGRAEYAFAVIDPAVVPEEKIKPQRTLIVLGGLVFGMLIGSVFVFVRRSMQQKAPGA